MAVSFQVLLKVTSYCLIAGSATVERHRPDENNQSQAQSAITEQLHVATYSESTLFFAANYDAHNASRGLDPQIAHVT
jgi:hypothetical protein